MPESAMSKQTSARTIPAKNPRDGLSAKEFDQLSQFIYDTVGIKLSQAKKTMVEARLQKRLRILKMNSHRDYFNFLFSNDGMQTELINLIDVVTTNTTDFFREPQHFEYLTNNVLPDWSRRTNNGSMLRIWSAGCSLGMEPYTLAIVMSEYQEKNPAFNWRILATDISTQALQKAVKAIYEEERVNCIPFNMKSKYLLRSKDRKKKLIRIVPELRKRVEFRRLNFMEPFSFNNAMDIIFCRNVVIYFDKQTQETLFNKFCRVLKPGGYLFIGHSESLAGMSLPLRQIIPTVYVRQ